MKRLLVTLSTLSMLAAAAPIGAAAQADWTLNVPIQVTNMSSAITEGAVICYVHPTVDLNVVVRELETLPGRLSVVAGIGPGQAFPEFPGANAENSEFVGYATFALDGSGNGPSSATVEIVAPADATVSQKLGAQAYGCAFGFRIDGAGDEWFSVLEPLNAEHEAVLSSPGPPTVTIRARFGTLSGG